MLIDRPLTDIAPTRIWDLETTEPFEESRKEKYPNSDLFHEISVETSDAHMSRIESESVSFEYDIHIERSDDIEKCEYITDTRNIVQGEMLKE
jgi:hypothetical protein